jgi:hypothetical protein
MKPKLVVTLTNRTKQVHHRMNKRQARRPSGKR